ncbi:MAG TPA: polymer-forming cytoskeletal protein, partial [Acidimicrobiia bacterium]
ETASSELVIIPEGETVEGDLYATGVRVIIEGVVDGDLIAFAAEEITISGEVTGSVLAAAPTVTVTGGVGESLRVSTGSLTLEGTISSDLVVASLGVKVDAGSEVSGDALIWALDLKTEGTIGANLEGSQRTLEIEGAIGGDVDVSVTRLTVTGPLNVAGDLGYRSDTEAVGLEEATVGGVVVHKSPLPLNIRVRALGVLARFLVVLGLTTAALLVAWGWPQRMRRAAGVARSQFLRSWGMGAVIMLSPLLLGALAVLLAGLAPDAASLPLLAIFGPLVLATGGVVLVLALVAGVPAVLALGQAIPLRRGLFGSVLVGSLATGLVWVIPWVGWLVPALVLPIGLGAWILSFRAPPEPEPS